MALCCLSKVILSLCECCGCVDKKRICEKKEMCVQIVPFDGGGGFSM